MNTFISVDALFVLGLALLAFLCYNLRCVWKLVCTLDDNPSNLVSWAESYGFIALVTCSVFIDMSWHARVPVLLFCFGSLGIFLRISRIV